MSEEAIELTVEELAKLLSAADVFVNNGDYPSWDGLSKAPGLGQDDYRKMARFLLRKLAITARNPEVVRSITDPAPGSCRCVNPKEHHAHQ